MVNTYTKIKLNICPNPLHKYRSKYDVVPKLLRHAAHYAIGCARKNGSTARLNSIWHFHSIQTWAGGAFTMKSRLNFAPLWLFHFWLFFLINRTSGWQDGSLPGSRTFQKAYVISELNAISATVYQYFLCSFTSGVAEVARNLCGQWRDVLGRLVEVWWTYVHWFLFNIICGRTLGLAVVWRFRRL